MASFPDGSDDEPRGREGGDGFRTIDILPVQLCRHGQQQAEMGQFDVEEQFPESPFVAFQLRATVLFQSNLPSFYVKFSSPIIAETG
jgi:hypothetical protein